MRQLSETGQFIVERADCDSEFENRNCYEEGRNSS